ncbi:MAG: hypothetical protein ACE5KM_01925 [Planctomycetaceae bacterium]
MYRIKPLALAAVLAAALSVPLTAEAGPSAGGGDTPTANLLDLYYDYQVWVADDVTRYYVVATDQNGKVTEEKFHSRDAAYDWASWLFFHDFTNVKVEKRVEMGDWMLIGTWDTRAEAKGWEAFALGVGFYAKIVPVSAFSSRVAKPYR